MSALQHIFVVDDDEATRQSMRSILRSVDYEVELFENGTQLLERAELQGLDGCIILDVRLPGPSGLEIQRRLNEFGIFTPIIFVTGHGDIAMAVQAMKANAVEFLTKPFRDQDLLDAISIALDQADARREKATRKKQASTLMLGLSRREREVCVRLCSGKVGKQIAYELDVSEATVKVHRRAIMHKLGVSSISQLILQYREHIEQFHASDKV